MSLSPSHAPSPPRPPPISPRPLIHAYPCVPPPPPGDIFESFSEHPPLLLPSQGFRLRPGEPLAEEGGLLRPLCRLRRLLWDLEQEREPEPKPEPEREPSSLPANQRPRARQVTP